MTEVSADDWNGKLYISNNAVDVEKLLALLQKRIIVNIDVQAYIEALAGLLAYYRASLFSVILRNANRLRWR